MAEIERKLFGKFAKNIETGLFSSFIMSTDLQKTSEWTADLTHDEASSETTEETADNFENLSYRLLSYMNMFHRLIPTTLGFLHYAKALEVDKKIYALTKSNGRLIKTEGDYELYELPFSFSPQIDRLTESAKNFDYGIGILPGIFLVGIVSYYDAFLAHLIKSIYLAVPEKLSSSERNISFKELVGLGSVEAAREFVLEKEIEAVMRLSHHAQIEWLEDKLGITLTKDLPIWSAFVEICERRNLFTHTNGIVSSQYMTVCARHGVDLEGRKVGDRLALDPKYFRKCINVISEFGLKLIQVVWRKLLPSKIDDAAACLNDVGYRLIARRRYGLASTLLEFGLDTMKRQGADRTRKMMVVNWANGQKLSGKPEDAARILTREDWSAASSEFQICVAAVRDDTEKVVSLIEVVAKAEQVGKDGFRIWPVFQSVKKDPKFVAEFERVFGEPYFTDKESVEDRDQQAQTSEGPAQTSGSLSQAS